MRQFQMQDRIGSAGTVGFATGNVSESQAGVKTRRLFVQLVDVHTGNVQAVDCIFYQMPTQAHLPEGGIDEQHFDFTFGYPHESHDRAVVPAQAVQFDAFQVFVPDQRLQVADIRLVQKVMRSAHRCFPECCQGVEIGGGGTKKCRIHRKMRFGLFD